MDLIHVIEVLNAISFIIVIFYRYHAAVFVLWKVWKLLKWVDKRGGKIKLENYLLALLATV